VRRGVGPVGKQTSPMRGTRAARKSVALLASILKVVCESGAKASGLLLILATAAGRATDFLAARVASRSEKQGRDQTRDLG
jgi:hypothetical protein